MAPRTHVDPTEVFAPVGFKAQITESGLQKSMCFLESGKEVPAPDFRDSKYSSNLLHPGAENLLDPADLILLCGNCYGSAKA